MNFGDAYNNATDVKEAQVASGTLQVAGSTAAANPVAVVIPQHLQGAVAQIQNLPMDQISNVGGNCGQEMGKLSDEILTKVKMVDTGELSTGVNNVLAMTQGIDLSQMGKEVGFFGKLKARVTGAKLDFMGQFETTADRIQEIVNNLQTGLDRMKNDAAWLAAAYEANIKYHDELVLTAEAVEIVYKQQQAELDALRAATTMDVNAVQDKQMYVDRLSKHHDKLLRLVQLAKLTAPEIRMLQTTNYNTYENFKDLRDITIPSWKKTISLGLVAIQQKKDAALGKSVADAANENLRLASQMIGANMVAAAEQSNRSVYDMETLEEVQRNFITSIKATHALEQTGRETRAQAAVRLKEMEVELRNELVALRK